MKGDRSDGLLNAMSMALLIIAAFFVVFAIDDKAWGWLVLAAFFAALAVLALMMDRRRG